MYKPGQLLTIDGKVYRVKRKHYWYSCFFCDARRICFTLDTCDILCKNAPCDCYLQLVTPKFSLG